MSKATIELEEGWHKIEEKGVSRIISFLENQDNTGFGKKDYSELYTIVYDMCTQPRNKNFSSHLYDRYSQTLVNYLEKFITTSLTTQQSSFPFLFCLSNSWSKYKTMTKWLKNFFQYLDRHHVTQNNLPSLLTVSDARFHEIVMANFKDNIIKSYLEILNKDREGEISDREVSKEVYQMILKLDYQIPNATHKLCTIIEDKVINETYVFYAAKSSN